jgi:3-oxoacyl-[acyl-carrier-protein] synthase II
LTAMSTRNDDPNTASRPFSRNRDGFVMGEGSGIVIMETLEHAQARGATILAEITGYGSSADAYRITDIHPEGRGPAAAMLEALADAGLDPTQPRDDGTPPVQYISAHGTSTNENDHIETLSSKKVFGDMAYDIPMTSIKSMMGHLICAAGAVEFITCLLMLRDQVIPPTINLHEPDPELDLDYVPNVKRETPLDTCLSNSFGFGGQNNTLVVTRV